MIETPLYGGEVLLQFDEARHQYRVVIKGRKYKVPSVTRITSIIDKSGPLVNWAINNTLDVIRGAIGPGAEYSETYLEEVYRAAKRESQRRKSEAASRGTLVHSILEGYGKGGVLPPESDCKATLAVEWLRASGIQVEESERRIYSCQNRYSGTLDAIGTLNGRVVLIDWKTGKSVYPEFRLQTAAYVKAYEEETGKRIEDRCLVRLGDDAVEPHWFGRETLRLDFAAFLGAKKLFEQISKIELENKKSKGLKE